MNLLRGKTNENRSLSKELKVEKVFCIISATFLFSWLPIIYMTTAGRLFSRWDIIPVMLPTVSLFTVAISSLVNPIIYVFLKPDFKNAICILLQRRIQDPNPQLKHIEMVTVVYH